MLLGLPSMAACMFLNMGVCGEPWYFRVIWCSVYMGGVTLGECVPPVGGDCFLEVRCVVSKQCGLLPSYTVDAHGRCKRYIECNMVGRTGESKCVAKSQK